MHENASNGYDVIIVGGGPAGLCAAMYAGRGMLKALTIERGAPGGELLNTDLIEDYIGFESIKGWDLAQKMSEHARKFGAAIVTDTVERVRKAEDGWFDVATSRGMLYRAPAVILTAGGQKQYIYHSPYRGYMSTVDDRPHFGLGAATRVDSLRVVWPDGRVQVLTNLDVDRLLVVRQRDAIGMRDARCAMRGTCRNASRIPRPSGSPIGHPASRVFQPMDPAAALRYAQACRQSPRR